MLVQIKNIQITYEDMTCDIHKYPCKFGLRLGQLDVVSSLGNPEVICL